MMMWHQLATVDVKCQHKELSQKNQLWKEKMVEVK